MIPGPQKPPDAPPARLGLAVGRGQLRALAALLREALVRWGSTPSLRHSFVGWAVGGLLLTMGASVSAGYLGSEVGLGSLIGALWWLAVTVTLFAGLGLADSYPDRRPLAGLGIPNGLTAIRAYMAVPVLLFAVMPDQYLGRDLFLSTAAPIAVLDALDGVLARSVGPVSVLGRALDPIMDATFFPIAAISCLLLGLVPAWLGALVLARYGIPALGFLFLYPWLTRRPEMVATWFGKVNTFASGAALAGSSVLVIAGAPTTEFDVVAGVVLGITAGGQMVSLGARSLRAGGSSERRG